MSIFEGLCVYVCVCVHILVCLLKLMCVYTFFCVYVFRRVLCVYVRAVGEKLDLALVLMFRFIIYVFTCMCAYRTCPMALLRAASR